MPLHFSEGTSVDDHSICHKEESSLHMLYARQVTLHPGAAAALKGLLDISLYVNDTSNNLAFSDYAPYYRDICSKHGSLTLAIPVRSSIHGTRSKDVQGNACAHVRCQGHALTHAFARELYRLFISCAVWFVRSSQQV
jgi:hypothetical protein